MTDKGTYLQGDKGTYLQGDKGTYLQGDGGTYLQGDGGTYLQGDGGTYSFIDNCFMVREDVKSSIVHVSEYEKTKCYVQKLNNSEYRVTFIGHERYDYDKTLVKHKHGQVNKFLNEIALHHFGNTVEYFKGGRVEIFGFGMFGSIGILYGFFVSQLPKTEVRITTLGAHRVGDHYFWNITNIYEIYCENWYTTDEQGLEPIAYFPEYYDNNENIKDFDKKVEILYLHNTSLKKGFCCNSRDWKRMHLHSYKSYKKQSNS